MTGVGRSSIVTSTANPRIKATAALARRKHRDAEGRYLIEGPRYVADALTTGDVEEVFALADVGDDLFDRVEAAGVRLTLVDEAVLAKLADSVTPQGVVAVARQRRARLADVAGGDLLVVLFEAADPGNVGAVIRTATGAGAAGVVLTRGSVDPWNPKAVRASAGTVAHLPLVVDVSLDEVAAACADAGGRLLALDAAGETSIEDDAVLAPPVALLFGNEAHGLPAEALSLAVRNVAVPLRGQVPSLNLAATVAVACFAAARVGERARRGEL